MLQAERQAGREEGSIYNGHTAREWSLALQGLMSESSEYTTDPQACADYVRRWRDDVMEQHAKALAALRVERDGLKVKLLLQQSSSRCGPTTTVRGATTTGDRS
jgi:hypothetical protein